MATASAEIGIPRRRSDGEGKVRGSTRYAADLQVHGLLHGRLVLAAGARGRLSGVAGAGRTGRLSGSGGGAGLGSRGVVRVLGGGALPFVDGAAGRAGQPLAASE